MRYRTVRQAAGDLGRDCAGLSISGGIHVLLCAAVLYLLLAPAAAARGGESPSGHVIPPGHEALFAEILGSGGELPGDCAFTGGSIEAEVARGVFRCGPREAVIELRHPSRANSGATLTGKFAIVPSSGTVPPGLIDAVAANVRAREGEFEWSTVQSQREPSSLELTAHRARSLAPWIVIVGIAGLLSVAIAMVTRRLRPRFARLWRLGAVGAASARDTVWRWLDVLSDPYNLACAVVLVVGIVLRGWLSVVNPVANDDHTSVAKLILEANWQPPPPAECMLCSHAKLYHYTLALALEGARGVPALGSLPNLHILVGNLLNFAAGVALLLLLVSITATRPWSRPVKVAAISFVSFNAAIVGIFSQATNDGFCILFASLAIYGLDRFLRKSGLQWLAVATAATILAAMSKSSGWAIFLSIAASLLLAVYWAPVSLRKRFAVGAAAFVLGFSLVVPALHPYRENIVRRGTPFVNDAFAVPQMEIKIDRPPYVWALQTFLTFRVADLLASPSMDYRNVEQPLHHDSLWTQIYGKMYFLRFEGLWPIDHPGLLWLGRLLFVLGLLPATALVLGAFTTFREVGRGMERPNQPVLREPFDWHFLIHCLVVVAAMIALIASYHHLWVMFVWMKVIYLFPALLAFYKLFLDGLEILWRRQPRFVSCWMACLVAVSIADMGWLIHDLTVAGAVGG